MPGSSNTSPFAGTAPYYALFRAPYPESALDFVVDRFNLLKSAHTLDLGCGPGTIAIPLSGRVGKIVAVDPDTGMISEGRRLAALRGRHNIEWLQASAEDISLDTGCFRVATIGQAFHWMDRDVVLGKLATLIEDGGGLALLNPGKRRPQESWEPVADQVVERFLGPRTRHPQSNPQEPEHESALIRSEYFSNFTAREFSSTVTRDLASILGCVYSLSRAARPLFGKKAKAFEAELAETLLKRNPTGVFNERVETEVVIARKVAR